MLVDIVKYADTTTRKSPVIGFDCSITGGRRAAKSMFQN